MKKGLVFFLGMITGAFLLVLVAFLLMPSSQKPRDDNSITMFAAPGEIMKLRSFEIMQVLPNGSALAHSSEEAKTRYTYYGDPLVLFTAEEGTAYYDDQIIEVPARKVVRPVGTYRYNSALGEKIVPIVKFFDK